MKDKIEKEILGKRARIEIEEEQVRVYCEDILVRELYTGSYQEEWVYYAIMESAIEDYINEKEWEKIVSNLDWSDLG